MTISRIYKNRILSALPKTELKLLEPHLIPVMLSQEDVLLDDDLTHAYFVEDGIASVVVSLENGKTVEVGIIGIDGVVGLPILLGGGSMPGRTFIQIAGSGYRIDAKELLGAVERSVELRQHVQRYTQGFLVQVSQTAVCNRIHNIEERLARWLLSCRDRMETDELRLTHDFLSQMLGSPRTTVTLAAGLLHRAGLIHYSRGVVMIENRGELEKSACECYGVVRDEFRRLALMPA